MNQNTPVINWQNIRCHNNSQHNGFEELVCQLAELEKFSNAEDFTRVGTPDGGVESYWRLSNEIEYGWQAKYFHRFGSSQWAQLDKSIETALETHPQLARYYVCVPIDRPDARVKNRQSAMDKWLEFVKKWTDHAHSNGRTLEIFYWGNHELAHRLTKRENDGLRYYWFSQEEFSQEWFAAHIRRSLDDLGPRYTPTLNIELDIAKNFDAISRNKRCQEIIRVHLEDLLEAAEHIACFHAQPSLNIETIDSLVSQVTTQCYNISLGNKIDTELVKNLLNDLETSLTAFQENRDLNLSEENRKHKEHIISKFSEQIYIFREFIESQYIALFNSPKLLLTGYAGTGKSHLLGDIANQKRKENLPCILLLGQQFSNSSSLWAQILHSLLRVDIVNESTLLGALNSLAKANNERLLFMIDAINEGDGQRLWTNHLNSFIHEFDQYTHIGLVLSLRTSYKEELIPSDAAKQLIEISHHGFEDNVFQATNSFFSFYGIELPSIPLLHPEFNNPLFLKLFCKGLQSSGQQKIPNLNIS